MKKIIGLMVLTVIASMCLFSSCREQLQAEPPSLVGDELVIATALRRHMYNHHNRFEYDYKFIFISVLGSDPSRDFMDYFDDIFSQVLPGSEMKETRYGYENLPETRGVWVRFEVVDFESISEQEASVACQTFEYNRENPVVNYRMLLQDGKWNAAGITGIQDDKILK